MFTVYNGEIFWKNFAFVTVHATISRSHPCFVPQPCSLDGILGRCDSELEKMWMLKQSSGCLSFVLGFELYQLHSMNITLQIVLANIKFRISVGGGEGREGETQRRPHALSHVACIGSPRPVVAELSASVVIYQFVHLSIRFVMFQILSYWWIKLDHFSRSFFCVCVDTFHLFGLMYEIWNG